MNSAELKLFSEEIEAWEPERILQWAVDRYKDRIVLTCSFGGGGIVLAHMLSRQHPDVPVVFLDTGFHFPETLQFKDAFAKRFGIRVLNIRPTLTVDEQATQFGSELYTRKPDLCCHMRKVTPLARALHELQVDAWVSALRRDQSPTRQHIKVLEWHTVAAPEDLVSVGGAAEDPHGASGGPGANLGADPDVESDTATGAVSPPRQILKIQPLANWTRQDVWRYIDEHDLPYHPLLDAGYTSIGCTPCTVPTSSTSDERSGRWAGTGKVECGLHTFSERT